MEIRYVGAGVMRHAAAVIVMSVPCCAWGGTLSVSGEFVSWSGGTSPEVTLRVNNPSTTAEELLGYQLELQLVAGPGATGVLQFNSATPPNLNYVFEGLFRFFPPPSYTGPPTTQIDSYMDIAVPSSRIVAPGDSYSLVTLDFDNSLLPEGLFYIELIPFDAPDGGSSYSAMSSGGAPTNFANATENSPPAVVGSVLVLPALSRAPSPTPEPSSFLLAMLGAGTAQLWRLRGHRRKSRRQ